MKKEEIKTISANIGVVPVIDVKHIHTWSFAIVVHQWCCRLVETELVECSGALYTYGCGALCSARRCFRTPASPDI